VVLLLWNTRDTEYGSSPFLFLCIAFAQQRISFSSKVSGVNWLKLLSHGGPLYVFQGSWSKWMMGKGADRILPNTILAPR
jgi:hypothetical protein